MKKYYLTLKKKDPFINYFSSQPKEKVTAIWVRRLDDISLIKEISNLTNFDTHAYITCSADLSDHIKKHDLLDKISNNLENNFGMLMSTFDDGIHINIELLRI